MNKTIRLLLILILIPCIFITQSGFSNISKNPKQVYRVYLKGKSLGLIKSKTELEKYIDDQQEAIKKKYKVDKVYAPADLSIVKEKTYNTNIQSTKEIYEKIKDISPFTISGYIVKIKGIDTIDASGKTVKGKTQTLYILDKSIFRKAAVTTVKSFISEEDYNKYAEDNQAPIEDVGKIIENIYIKNKITIKKQNIPVNKKIFQTEKELTKYLMFGENAQETKYTVTAGDSISDIAFNNKLSVDEFLIANPKLNDEKSLLSAGQQVSIISIKPQFSVVEEDHVVFKEEKNYETETKYDNNKDVGFTEVTQAGVKGENKVTQKIQKVNGETTNVVTVSTEVIKEPIKEIITKGGRQSAYYGGGYGSVVPTKGQWGWPATCSSVSSPFGWRWGVLHDGTDIAGCGYGSNIFAAQSGTVVESSARYPNGQYITIDHHNGYYTMYAHLCVGCRYVSVGQHVEKGQVIGGMGQTGAATGVHLHFAIWQGYPYRGGRALNAMSFY